jgi:hypothetical protein
LGVAAAAGAAAAFLVGLVAFLGNLSQILGFVATFFGAPIPAAPSEKPASVYCARFEGDVTYPDGTAVAAGAEFEKVWRIANCGDGNWRGLRIVRTQGTFGPEEFDAPPTPPNQLAEVRARFTAPSQPGRHRAAYAIRGAAGPFRDGFWVEIVVNP